MVHVESFGIGTAMVELKNGGRVKRAGWIGWIELRDGVIQINAGGVKVPWTPSQADLLGVDWNVVKREET